MIQKIDRHIIARHNKNKHKRFYAFIASTPGFILTTLIALYQNITELLDSWEEGHYVLFCIFMVVAGLLVFFLLRHTIWHRRIEHLEYRLKLVEAAIILYIGCERCHHFALEKGYLSFRVIVLAICTLGTVGIYCIQSRLFYLKKINVLSDVH